MTGMCTYTSIWFHLHVYDICLSATCFRRAVSAATTSWRQTARFDWCGTETIIHTMLYLYFPKLPGQCFFFGTALAVNAGSKDENVNE